MNLNVLDIILAVPMLLLVYRGWKQGLVQTIATLIGLLAGIWAAVHLSQWVAELIGLKSEDSVLIAFVVCFVGALVIAYFLGRMVEGLMKAVKLSIVNRVAGALFGLAKALCILSILLGTVVMFDRDEVLIKPELKENSLLYKPVYTTGSRLTDSLKQFVDYHKDEWRKEVLE